MANYVEWEEFIAQYNVVLNFAFNATINVIGEDGEYVGAIGGNEIVAVVYGEHVGLFIGRSLVWANSSINWFEKLQDLMLI